MGSISYSELKKGLKIILNNQPYEIIEASSMFKARGHSVVQAKLKNLITNETTSQTFRPSDSFEETEIIKEEAEFLYSHRNKYFFSFKKTPSKRFDLSKKQIGSAEKFLKPGQIVEALIFKHDIINISLPVKISLKVTESPPGVQGDRSQAGTKTVVLETKAEINAPLFIKQGDIIEINTEKEEYVRRIRTSPPRREEP